MQPKTVAPFRLTAPSQHSARAVPQFTLGRGFGFGLGLGVSVRSAGAARAREKRGRMVVRVSFMLDDGWRR